MKCKNCGYEYNGIFCPECGTRNENNASTEENKPVEEQKKQEILGTQEENNEKKQGISATQSSENEGKTMAVLSLVFGVISLCTFGVLWIPQILGIVFGLLGKKQGKMRGKAKGGLICSLIAMAIAITAIVVALMVSENSSDMTSDSESIPVEKNISSQIESSNDTGNNLSGTFGEKHTFAVGDTISFEGGIEITVLEVGQYEDYVYVGLEIKNDNAEPFMVGEATPLFYGDDYPMSNSNEAIESSDGSITGLPDEFVITQSITEGRKVKGRFYGYCDNYSGLSVIEAEIANAVIIIKDANTVGVGESVNVPEDGTDNPDDSQGMDVFLGYGYEGDYVIAAQSNISGTVEQIYSQAFGDGYYIQLEGTNEFGEEMAISGIATESAAASDAGSNVYYMWEESCDNLQFMVTFHDSDYMDIQYSEAGDDREEYLGQTFSGTYYRQQ